MTSFSPTLIQELVANKDDLKHAIIESKGFVLYLADKYTIALSPELLIETINPYSIRFISEHMKSHKYTPEQTEIVISYLTEDNHDNEETITEYSLQDLLKDIKEDIDLPRNAGDLLKVSFEDFLKHQKEFVQLIYRSNDQYWGASEFFSSHFLLSSIFKKLSKEQFLQIDKQTLDSCPALFDMSKQLMEDNDIRILFNSVVTEYYNHPDRVSGGYKPRLESYKNYSFNKEEKELFLNLLKNDYTFDYKRVKSYAGFDNFFTKDEYILTQNISGIQYFSEKEIADNLPQIRKGIIAAYFKSHYQDFEKIYNLHISKDAFKDIFKPQFIEEMIKISGGFHFHYFDRDNKNKTDSMNFIHQEVLTLCAHNTDLLNMVGYQNCINNITSLIEHDKSYFNETYSNAAQNILTKFEEAVKTSYLFANTTSNKVSCFSEYDVPSIIFTNMKGKESINYLFALIKIEEATKHWKKEPFKEEINRIIPLLSSVDVKSVTKSLHYKIDNSLLKDNPRQDFDNNFLNFTPEIIKSMSFDNFTSIFSISKEFRSMVLKNDLDYILINNTLENNNNRNLITTILDSIENDKSTYFSFMKSFIKKNKEFMLKHYFSNLVTHTVREDLVKIDTSLLEKNSYQNIENIMNEFSEKSLSSEHIYAGRDKLSKQEKKKIDSLKTAIDAEKKILEKIINDNFPNISFDFYSKKIQDANPLKAIQLYNISKSNQKEYKFMVFDKIESLDFLAIKELINNKQFLNFIFANKVNTSNSSSEKERSVFFNKNFNASENIEIVETLLKNFNNPELFLTQYESNISLSKILYLITKEQRFEISNDLAIKYDPVDLFNSYDYLPKENGYFEKHVKKTFSNEQILNAVANLNSKGLKIISLPDQNLRHDNLLSHNFKYEERDGKNPQLKIYLDLLKALENDPINYLACIHSDIVHNFTNDKAFKSRDLAITDFYNRYIDIDVLVKAMKEIFSIHKEMTEDRNLSEHSMYKGIAVKNAVSAVSSFISFSYSSNDDVYSSEITEEKSSKILKTLIEEAPYFIFGGSTIGKLNIEQEISSNFNDYFHKDLIDDFFISSSKNDIVRNNFSLDYSKKDNWQNKIVHEFITTIIKNLTEKQDSENIYKLDFIIKEHKFNEERPYGKNLKEFNSTLASFISHQEYEKFLEKSLGYIKMIQLTERLDNKPRLKVKSTKI